MTPTPTLLKLFFTNPICPARSLISLQRPAPSGAFLSLSGSADATLVPTCSKRELFHLEYIPGSIGAGFFTPGKLLPFLHTTQALSHALLQLGVRIRLRSVHGRVLRVDSGENRIIPVVQDGPKSDVDEVTDKEMVLTPFKIDNGKEAEDDMFIFKEVETGLALSIDKGNVSVSKMRMLQETPVLLVDENEAKPVCVRYGTHDWGVVHLGCAGSGDEEVLWLMAGPKGRLELRSHTSAWETFTVEFVRQSLDVAVKELPESPVYRAASDETRTAVRTEIISKIEEARGMEEKRKKDGFDHSAALAGLSDEPRKAKRVSERGEEKDGVAKDSRDTSKGGKEAAENKQDKRALKPVPAAPAPLPRNKVNRKAAKRNKNKKQKAKNSQSASNNMATTSQPSVTEGEARLSPKTDSASSKETADDGKVSSPYAEDKALSLSGGTSANSVSGPPCAACGRRLEGVYTTALGKNFHPQCFCCGRCKRPMGAGAGKFRERGGVPYCQECFATHLASQCARCLQPIMDTVVTAMDKTWHKECLTCTICGLPLTQTFWLYADKPNEPRCSRCVTGSEEYNGGRLGSGRRVNLPMLGKSNTSSMSFPPPVGNLGSSAERGRVRLMNPIVPSTSRR